MAHIFRRVSSVPCRSLSGEHGRGVGSVIQTIPPLVMLRVPANEWNTMYRSDPGCPWFSMPHG
jgi:hypothetical protein